MHHPRQQHRVTISRFAQSGCCCLVVALASASTQAQPDQPAPQGTTTPSAEPAPPSLFPTSPTVDVSTPPAPQPASPALDLPTPAAPLSAPHLPNEQGRPQSAVLPHNAGPSAGAPSRCAPDWVSEHYPRLTRVGVWVESGLGGAAGVLVTPKYVVTQVSDLLRTRGPWRVRFADDTISAADVVVMDEPSGLAVLELRGARDIAPLELGDDSDVISGMPVLLLGQPSGRFEEDDDDKRNPTLRNVPSVAYVGSHDAKQLTLGVGYGYGGSPAVGCDGRLYGVVTWTTSGASRAAGAAELRRVLGLVGSQGHYVGNWRWFEAGHTGLAIDIEKDFVAIGFAAGVSVLAYDRVELLLEDGLLFPTGGTTPGARFFLDVALGYRWLLDHSPRNYLSLGGGVGFTFDMFERLEYQAVDPQCTGEECDRNVVRPGDAEPGVRGYTLGRLAWLSGNSFMALTLRFSKRDPHSSMHFALGGAIP